MLRRLIATLMLFAAAMALVLPQPGRAQDPAGDQETLPDGVPVPPAGMLACYWKEQLCVWRLPDYIESKRNEAFVTLGVQVMSARITALEEELAKLKASCAAKLEVVPDESRKRS